jgi:hypothetical protein
MAILQFPPNPTTGQIFAATNGINYTWDGVKWLGKGQLGTAPLPAEYVLPQASPNQLGGIKPGSGLVETPDGVLSVRLTDISTDILPTPTDTYKIGSPSKTWKDVYVGSGGVHVGSTTISSSGGNLNIDAAGVTLPQNVTYKDAANTTRTLGAPATSSTTGLVSIGDNINVTNAGQISVPVATNSTLGVVKAGSNVSIDGTGAINIQPGAGINTLEAIANVNSTSGGAALNDGALLVYNSSNNRWDTVNNLRSDTMDGGFF